MPLKHLTETVLVILLALLTIATGVVVPTFPAIPEGFFPWAGVFAVTLFYPAAIYPMLKRNRADYAFRGLHFAPAAIAIGWLLIQVAMLKEPRVEALLRVYTWGFAAPAVGLTFLLLAAFCLRVIRRRVPRIAFLTLFFAPFIVLAAVSEYSVHWDDRLASLLWRQKPLLVAQEAENGKNSSALSLSSKGEKNLSKSSVPEEEAWRAKLRAVEQGKIHASSAPSVLKAETSLQGVKAVTALISSTKRKSKLPKSGGEFESLLLFFAAAVLALAHQRARRMAV